MSLMKGYESGDSLMEKKLPIYFPPVSDCYSADAGVTSVLQAFDKYNPDLFINRLYLFRKPNKVLKFATIDKTFDFSVVEYNNSDVIGLIHEKINKNKYIFMYLDHFYIKNSDRYQKNHFMHDFALIYGYNLEKKIFLCADNFVKGKYSQLEISYQNLYNSRCAVTQSELFKNNKNFVIFDYKKKVKDLDLAKVKKILEDFLNGQYNNIKCLNSGFLNDNIFGFSHGQAVNCNECIWGIKIFEWLLEEIDYIFENSLSIDLRPFHLLANYQSILQSFLLYINRRRLNAFDCSKDSIIIQHQIDECLIIRNLAIKYNLTKDRRLLNKLKRKIKQIEGLEYEFIAYLIELCR